MNKLISFGDSFTWGTDLKDCVSGDPFNNEEAFKTYLEYHHTQGRKIITDRMNIDHGYKATSINACFSRLTWPALLAEHLNLEYFCYAQPGFSNHAILRTILKLREYFNKGDTIVVNWTWLDRWEYYIENPIAKTIIPNKWKQIRPDFNKSDLDADAYYRYFYTDVNAKYEALKTILLTNYMLKSKEVNVIMTCIDENIADRNYDTFSFISELQDQTEELIQWFDGLGFYNWAKENKFSISEKWHPLEDAHYAAYKFLVNKLEL